MPPEPRKKIQGYRQSQGPTRGWTGLDGFHALQNRSTLAFEDATRPGESAPEIARELRARGRSAGPAASPRQRYLGESRPRGSSRADNIRRAMKDGSFDTKRKQFNETNSDKQMDENGKIGEPASADPPKFTSPADIVPYMLKNIGKTKAPTAEDAQMARGRAMADAEKVKRETKAARVRYLEDASPAKHRAMLKDAAMGRSVNSNATITDATGKAVGTGTTIDSKFGTGSLRMLTPEQQIKRPEATTTDDFGKTVTMKDYLGRKKYVQSTKINPTPRTQV